MRFAIEFPCRNSSMLPTKDLGVAALAADYHVRDMGWLIMRLAYQPQLVKISQVDHLKTVTSAPIMAL